MNHGLLVVRWVLQAVGRRFQEEKNSTASRPDVAEIVEEAEEVIVLRPFQDAAVAQEDVRVLQDLIYYERPILGALWRRLSDLRLAPSLDIHVPSFVDLRIVLEAASQNLAACSGPRPVFHVAAAGHLSVEGLVRLQFDCP